MHSLRFFSNAEVAEREGVEAVGFGWLNLRRGDGSGAVVRRGVPARRIGGRLVTTVFDLMLAQYGVTRDGLPGEWPTGYDDASAPYTPAWQAEITGVPAAAAIRVAREFAANAEESGGRSMIAQGRAMSALGEDTSMEGVAGAALWLCSDLGRSTTGEVVHVDAGFRAVGLPEDIEG